MVVPAGGFPGIFNMEGLCRDPEPLLSTALQPLPPLPHHEPLVVPGIPVSKYEGWMSLDDQTCQRHQHPG